MLNKKRNYGIDLLRLVSMYMVVVLHVCGCGGVLENVELFSVNYYVANFFEVVCYGAVDIFAMISGFVMVNSKYSYIKIFPTWLTTFFYSTVITLLCVLLYSKFEISHVNPGKVLASFFPVVTGRYWYVTSYCAMFLFIPYLNLVIHSLNQHSFRKLICILFVLFSILPRLVNPVLKMDLFNLNYGYSVLWLSVMFVFGAYVKLYPPKISGKICLFLCFVSPFLILISMGCTAYINQCFNVSLNESFLLGYTSPLTLVPACSLLLLFSRLDIRSLSLKKIIAVLSPLAFSVYLIHTHPLIFPLLKDKFVFIAKNTNAWELAGMILFASIMIFVSCICIDFFRFSLFKKVGVFDLHCKTECARKFHL